MLVEIEDKIISTQIFERKFVCDLNACKGACCVEGDQGAPLTQSEVSLIEKNLEYIKPYMRKEGVEAIKTNGVASLDEDFEAQTTLVDNKECAFVYFDEANIAKCAIEKAQRENKIDFIKPISCHLYPIRTKQFNNYTALNYEQWTICQPACACGEKLNMPVFKFLKAPLIRAFGEDFYKELENISQQLESAK